MIRGIAVSLVAVAWATGAWAQTNTTGPAKTDLSWSFNAEYVAAGDIELPPGASLREDSTNLTGGLAAKRKLAPWLQLGGSLMMGTTDDNLPSNEDVSHLTGGVTLAIVDTLPFVPALSYKKSAQYAEVLNDYVRADDTLRFETAFTFPRAPATLKLVPSISVRESTVQTRERISPAVLGSVEVNVLDTSWTLSGEYEEHRYTNDQPGMTMDREEDRTAVTLEAGVVDLLGRALPQRVRPFLKGVTLAVRWVDFDSNLPDPDASYSRWQFVPAIGIGGALW